MLGQKRAILSDLSAVLAGLVTSVCVQTEEFTSIHHRWLELDDASHSFHCLNNTKDKFFFFTDNQTASLLQYT